MTDKLAQDRAGSALLERVRSVETLGAAYEAWDELRKDNIAHLRDLAEERARLDQQGNFLVGAVRAAAPAWTPSPPGELPVPAAAGLHDFLAGAEGKVAAARASLEARAEAEAENFEAVSSALRELVRDRVVRFSQVVRPSLRLVFRAIGTERAVLHLNRLRGDAPVLLLHALTGAIPSRYGFLEDDSTETLGLEPPTLYPEEGVREDEAHAGARALALRLLPGMRILPVKGFLPVWTEGASGIAARFFRFRSRGVVLEAETVDGDQFRPVLTRPEAEALAGHLLRLKVQGRIELELATE